ncbi:enoyl-CoA hydratase/isomerase family protein [Chloroflexota bacterium]
MDYETIILKKEEGVATIILNRPDKGNSINIKMSEELPLALEEVVRDKEVRVMILTGAGRGFCGGGDVGVMSEGGDYSQPPPEKLRQFINEVVQGITRTLQRMEIPTIAMVNGFAVGGGFDYACACDMRIGSENARFTNAFIKVGLVPETGGCYLLPRIVGLSKALDILYSGKWVDAKEAEKIGLLNKLVPAEELEKETMELAKQIAKSAPIAMKLTKQLAINGLESDLDTALNMAAAYQAVVTSTQDHQEGLAAWLEKREPVFKGNC